MKHDNLQQGGSPYGGLLMSPKHYERLAWVESRHDSAHLTKPDLTNGKAGPLQLSPIAFEELQKKGYFKNRDYKSLTGPEALAGGMKYSSILAEYGFKDEHWNAAAYNMGPTKARSLYQKYQGNIKKAIGDPDFPQTTKNYLFDYTMAKSLPSRQAETDYIEQMYKIIQDGKDVNTFNPKARVAKRQEGSPTYGEDSRPEDDFLQPELKPFNPIPEPNPSVSGSVASASSNFDDIPFDPEKGKKRDVLGFLTGKDYTKYTAPLGSLISSQADGVGLQGDKKGVIGGTALGTIGGFMTAGPIGAITQGAASLMKYAINATNKADQTEQQNKAWLAANSINGDTGRVAYMEAGGNVNKTGYTPGTDSFENDFNIIPSNHLTMKNTPFDVLGIPNVGKLKVMKAGVKRIMFPSADYVTEIPIRQSGGEAPEIVPANNLVPLQVSKEELVIHPNYDVTKPGAKKTHKEYKSSGDSNKVTDTLTPLERDEMGNIIAPGAYVVSNDKNLKVPRKLAEKIKTELTPAFYSEDLKLPEAQEKTLAGEFYGKAKGLTPVAILKKVLNKYKKPENVETDIFDKMAWEGNKKSRIPYLDLVKDLNTLMRGDTPEQAEIPEAKKGMEVRRYEEGSEIEDYINKRLKDLENKNFDNSNLNTARLFTVGSGIAASAASALQNPANDIYSTSSELQARKFKPEDVSRIARVYDNSLADQDAIKMQVLENQGVSAQKVPFYLSSNNNVNERNKAVLNAGIRNDQLDRQRAAAEDQNLANYTAQVNKNKEFQNQYIFNVTRPLVNTISNLGNLSAQESQAKQAFESGKEGEISNLIMSKHLMKVMDKFGRMTGMPVGTSSFLKGINSTVSTATPTKTLSNTTVDEFGDLTEESADNEISSIISSNPTNFYNDKRFQKLMRFKQLQGPISAQKRIQLSTGQPFK